MTTYSNFQDQTASEKITLATINAKKRLMAWSLYSGAIYKLESQEFDKLVSIQDEGSSYIEVNSISAIATGKYYYDRQNSIIYLQSSDSNNPNSHFLVATITFYFANLPVRTNHDLSNGYSVFWKPLIDSVSKFGVELDTSDQIGVAIEGSGQIVLLNDQAFFEDKYDRISWENQSVNIYSWSSSLPITEAKKIYQGKINGKTYSSEKVTFKLKDLLQNIRQPFILDTLDNVAGALIPPNLYNAKQRFIYGKVIGFRPTNIDQSLPETGYELGGTVSVTNGSQTVTGTATTFLNDFSPDDKIIIESNIYTVESVTDNLSLTMSEAYAEPSVSGVAPSIDPDKPKNYINRIWKVSGHAINQPTTTIQNPFSQNRFFVNDGTDFNDNDFVYIGTLGSGELHQIDSISSNLMVLKTNLATVPSAGTVIYRLALQNVRINDLPLRYERDFLIDATNGTLTLNYLAEFNVSPIRVITGTLSFNSTRAVTGTNTFFTKQLEPGMWIRTSDEADWFQISSIESDTDLTLKTTATYTDSGASQYKPFHAMTSEDILTCDVYGMTTTGVSTAPLISTGSLIMKDILTRHGLGSIINTDSFTRAHEEAPQLIGLVIPDRFSDTSTPKVRDIVQKINLSILSSLVQNEDFELECNILRPSRPTSIKQFREFDIISFSIDTDMDRIVKAVNVKYQKKEYDYLSRSDSFTIESKISDNALYLIESQNEKDIETLLVEQNDARIFASRWAFLLELGSSVIKLRTKLRGSRLQANDKIEILHEKFYERIGGGKHKISAINSLKKDGLGCEIETEDLGNAFTRVCYISPDDSKIYSDANDNERFVTGYITDEYGLIDNNENTYGLQEIW